MAIFNAVPSLKSGSDDFALTLEREGSSMVVEAFRTKALLVGGDNKAILKKQDEAGVTSQFIRKAWDPRPEIAYEFGAELIGQNYGFQEIFIAQDPRPIVAHAFVPKHLRRAAHFDMWGPILQGKVDEVIREMDRRAFLALHKATRQTSGSTLLDSNGVLTISNGANRVTVQNGTGVTNAFPVSSAGATSFRQQVAALRKLARDRDVPDGGTLYITPYIAQVLSQDTGIYDVQYAQNQSMNNVQRALIGMMEAFNVMVVPGTDRMRNTNINSASGTSGYPSRYWNNYSYGAKASAGEPVAVAVFDGPEGTAPVGMRQLGPVDIEQEKTVKNQGDLIAVSAWIGFDVLDSYLAGSIEVTSD